MKTSSEEIAQHTHQVQDHEAEKRTLYTKVEELASQPDLYEPNTQEEFVDLVQRQLHCCEVMERDCATTHSLIFSLGLVSTCRHNRSPKPGGHLCCSACRSPFQFYDKLRCIAMAKLDEDPNRLSTAHIGCNACCPAGTPNEAGNSANGLFYSLHGV